MDIPQDLRASGDETSSGRLTTADAPTAEAKTPFARASRGWAGWCARILLGLLPFVWLARKLDLGAILSNIEAAGMSCLLAAIASLLIGLAAGVLRWRALLIAYGAVDLPPLITLARYTFVAAYFNLLPSGAAGDAMRGYRIRNHVADLSTSYTVLLVERIAGLVGLLIVALPGVMLGRNVDLASMAALLATAVALTIGLTAVVLVLPVATVRLPWLRPLLQRVPLVGNVLLRIPKAASSRGLLEALLLSTVTQAASVTAVLAPLWRLVGPRLALACSKVAPIAILLTYVPITPGGVFQREAIYKYVFGIVGIGADVAVAGSVMFFVAQLSVAALGGLVYLAERLRGSSQ